MSMWACVDHEITVDCGSQLKGKRGYGLLLHLLFPVGIPLR